MRDLLPLATELEIRNLYLYDGYGPQKIAEMTGAEYRSVTALITRDGLAKLRKQSRALAVKEHGELATSSALQAAQAIAAKSEQHALKALDKTGDALDANDSLDASRYSATARNLVSIARAVVGAGSADAVAAGQVNLFFVQQVTRQVGEECLG